MTVRTFIMAAVLIIPVFVFNISCEKEQPMTEESTIEPSVQDSAGEPPFHSGSLQGDEADTGEDEDISYESDEDEAQDEDPGFETEKEDADESYEPEEDEGEEEDTVYESHTDEQA